MNIPNTVSVPMSPGDIILEEGCKNVSVPP